MQRQPRLAQKNNLSGRKLFCMSGLKMERRTIPRCRTRTTVFLCVSVLVLVVGGFLLLDRRPFAVSDPLERGEASSRNPSSLWSGKADDKIAEPLDVSRSRVGPSDREGEPGLDPAADSKQKPPPSSSERASDNDSVRPSDENRGPSLNSAQGDPFALSDYFSFPHPEEFKPVSELNQTAWWEELIRHLIAMGHPKQVVIVAADMLYQDHILNWLIANYLILDKPMDNILILTPDKDLYDLFKRKGFSLLHMPFDSYLTKAKSNDRGKPIWLMRLGILRLLSHWGINVANFDSDATPIKNLQERWDSFKDQDIVASLGTWERAHWTICMGVIYFRSSATTELYWKTMQSHPIKNPMRTGDDQYRMNDLICLSWNIKWDVEQPIPGKPILGQTTKNNLKVAILPETEICRQHCEANETEHYYVWHKRNPKAAKAKAAIEGGVWYLKTDWKTVISKEIDLTGKDWLGTLRAP